MNTLIKFGLLGAVLFGSVSCSDEFLEQTPEQSLSIDNAVEDLVSLNAAVNGIYSNMQDANIYGWDLPLIPDLRGDNAYISQQNAGRFINYDDLTLTEENGRVEDEWVDGYEVVVNASNIINRAPSVEFLDSERADADQLIGEAFALRGLMYWNLLRMFAPPFTADGGASPGIALNNEGTNGEIAMPARSTVAEGYAQVVSDLLAAIDLMSKNTNGRLSKEAAQAILAKVYLYQENWEGAETQASAVIASDKYMLYADSASWFGSWGGNFGSEDIFALVNNDVDNFGVNSIGGIVDQNGYGDVLGTDDLFAAYSETDYRRSALELGNRVDGEMNVYFVEAKYPDGELGTSYIKIVRLSDVYLIRAEARAERGNEGGARMDLDAVASLRDSNYENSDESGDDLIDAILDERRREFALEGDRVYDLTRRKKSWTNFGTFENIEVSWDNPQLINPIPRLELNNNDNITQNRGY